MTFTEEFGHWPHEDKLHDALRILWNLMYNRHLTSREREALIVVLPYCAEMETMLRVFVHDTEVLYDDSKPSQTG